MSTAMLRAQTNLPVEGNLRPWRKATLRKAELAVVESHTIGAASVPINRVLEGTGFLYGVNIELAATTAGNSAAVAFTADGPWSALQNVVFKDVGPDTMNLSGYSLFLANLYGGYGVWHPETSTDTNVFQAVTGTGGTGGSFRANLLLPLAINVRSLIGIMGNQDRAVKYELRTDLAPSGSIYSVAPTTLAPVTIARTLRFATVPAPMDAGGVEQEQIPPHYGVIHLLNELRSEANPVSASTVNHFLRGIGNTIRTIILVFRDSTGARTNAMLPTRITFRIGADTLLSETSQHRRKAMYDQYLFDAPAGVLVYSFVDGFSAVAGYELGDDWLDTRNVANAQFEMVYPTFANSPGSLTVITDSLVIPPGLDISEMV